jgi:ferredoxin-NADP reductase
MQKPRRRPALLVRARTLSRAVRLLVLRITDGEPFEHVAGQWVDVVVDTPAGPLKRAYSIASAPTDDVPAELELAVTRVPDGPVSTALHALAVDTPLEVVGPSGLFTRERLPPGVASLFVGTGTGVTPLRAMIHDELRQRPEGPPMTLLFGCRTEEDLIFRDEFESLAARHPRLRYEPTLSRPDGGWSGRRGRVQEHIPELLAALPQDGGGPHVFICGLSPMVGEVRELLKAPPLSLDRRRVHSERYD